MKITLDLTNRPEFAGPLAAAWAHTDPLFDWRLNKLKWLKEWNLMLAGLRRRYEALPDRPHSVFETFLRGADGYIPVIIVGTSDETGKPVLRGMLLKFRTKLCFSAEARTKALTEVGEEVCTRLLAEATHQADYPVVWERR